MKMLQERYDGLPNKASRMLIQTAFGRVESRVGRCAWGSAAERKLSSEGICVF